MFDLFESVFQIPSVHLRSCSFEEFKLISPRIVLAQPFREITALA